MKEYAALLDSYIEEYNNTPSRGRDMDNKSPNEVYRLNLPLNDEGKPIIRKVNDITALDMLCGTIEERTVRKNAVQILNNFYFHDDLLGYHTKKVVVSYVPENIDTIFVFDTDFRLICKAEAQVITPYRKTTEEDFRQAKKQQKKARELVKKYRPTEEANIHNIIASNQLQEKQYSKHDEICATMSIIPAINKNSKRLKEINEADDWSMDDMESLTNLYEMRKRIAGGY
jgi:hypothetical protein